MSLEGNGGPSGGVPHFLQRSAQASLCSIGPGLYIILAVHFREFVFSEVRFWWAKSFGKSSKKPHTPLRFIGNSSACAFLAARVRTRALRGEGQDD
jgi:hypothetical protein